MSANGEIPSPSSSAFINHLGSYPIVSDSVSYFKEHPLGKKSIAVSNTAYDKIIKPFTPYIVKVNHYASPYVSKCDSMADSGLGRLEARLPIVKEPTDQLKDRITSTVGYPKKAASGVLSFGNEKKDYVLKVYSDEYSKMGGDPKGLSVVPAAKAGVTTTIIVSANLMEWVGGILAGKKEQAKEVVEEKTSD